MATQTVPPAPSTTQTIRVPATEVLPGVQPIVSVGEVVRFVVRQNNAGLGQLYLRGVLVPASLPPELNAGDKVLAKVTAANEQLIFKILDAQNAGTGQPAVGGLSSKLADEISALVKQLGATGLKGPLPLDIASDNQLSPEKLLGELANKLKEMLGALGSEEQGQGANAYKQLLASTDGTLAANLRASAANIRNILSQTAGDPFQQYVSSLQTELGRLLGDENASPQLLKRQAELLFASISEQLKNNRFGSEKERAVLQLAHDELQQALNNPVELKKALQNINNQLSNPNSLDPRRVAELEHRTGMLLREVAERLENLAQTQDRLNQLNPLMQALGEPALILFPFLMQGLLSHSEVTVQSRNEGRRRNGKNKGDGEASGEGNDAEANNAPYQRIQVSVPLPTMGIVDVDIAHRQDEILARFTVEDPEVGEFLLEQLEHLATILRAQNFKRAELVAHVGKTTAHTPSWAVSLRAGTSIFA